MPQFLCTSRKNLLSCLAEVLVPAHVGYMRSPERNARECINYERHIISPIIKKYHADSRLCHRTRFIAGINTFTTNKTLYICIYVYILYTSAFIIGIKIDRKKPDEGND